ncbi:MAG TPA: OadG family protein [Candidatus Blautia faecavium]|uniref:OadG family protein n=1 Tax=Candidatus Blautia faecavium TaxID=2838487 RepID=A0A9D2LQQ3_9FIRM|nr:OadG family protein [Candidatus Blautia faecavium]
MDMTTVIQALEIMVKGMVGIFVAILIIMLCVFIMGKLGTRDAKNDKKEEN